MDYYGLLVIVGIWFGLIGLEAIFVVMPAERRVKRAKNGPPYLEKAFNGVCTLLKYGFYCCLLVTAVIAGAVHTFNYLFS